MLSERRRCRGLLCLFDVSMTSVGEDDRDDSICFGPPRGFWCMSFEGFNKIVKQATEISNYRQEDLFVLEHWMLKSARVLRRKRDAGWKHAASSA